MLSAIIIALKDIINLLKIAKEGRKMDVDITKATLEINKLEHESAQRQNVIQIASLEETKKYDPKTRALFEVRADGIIGAAHPIGELGYVERYLVKILQDPYRYFMLAVKSAVIISIIVLMLRSLRK